ncbi:MAG: hypothetical protein ACAI34_13270 [Verrucomicrobium sp.]|nr:hypothetical protein [Verrucomicrobium sp.]
MAANFEYSLLPPDDPPPGRFKKVVIGILILVVLAATGTYFGAQYVLKQIAVIKEGETPVVERVAAAEVQFSPLQFPKEAPTWEDLRPKLQAWYESAWQIKGLHDPAIADLPQEKWQVFVAALVGRELQAPFAPSARELDRMATALLPHADAHPVLGAALGHAYGNHPGAVALLEKAFRSLSKQPGQETLAYLVACDIAAIHISNGSSDSVREASLSQAAEALRKSLAEEKDWAVWHDTLMAHLFTGGIRQEVFRLAHEEMLAVAKGAPVLKPWVVHWLAGRDALLAAAETTPGRPRGSKPAPGRNRHTAIKDARASLEAAYAGHPQSADPASDLIYAILLDADVTDPVEQMRRALDLGTAQEVDSFWCYYWFGMGLNYRTQGDDTVRLRFGEACLESGRFDTFVPYWFANFHHEQWIAQSRPEGYFEGLDFSLFRKLHQGYENDSRRASYRSLDRTLAAVMSLWCGQYDEADRWLKKLEGRPQEFALEYWERGDGESLLSKVGAFTSRHKTLAVEAAEMEKGFLPESALERYKAALTDSGGLEPAAVHYFQQRAAAMELETALAAGSRADLVPEADFRGWTSGGGGWVASPADPAIWEHGGRTLTSNTVHLARVGPRFVLAGEIEFENSDPYADLWFSMGQPERRRDDPWASVRFIKTATGLAAIYSQGLKEEWRAVTLSVRDPNRIKFVISTSGGGLDLEVDGKNFWKHQDFPPGFVPEDNAQIGLGARTSSVAGRVRVKNLVLRRR